MASVKVAVRVRPLNKREVNMESKCIIEMEGKRTSIVNLKMAAGTFKASNDEKDDQYGRERVKDFFFDYSYWSFDENSAQFTSQEKVYQDLGTDVVNSADEGYNACIFAYGQTGSGKTHTMMGQPGNEGLIPRICENLFKNMHEKENEGVSFRAEVSYLEIYNERVRDLLRTHQQKSEGQATHTLRVREHPKGGPYVQGLTKHMVSDYSAIEVIMKQGNELRTTASTNMNDTSSRSHAIFTVNFTQAKFMHDMPSETTSKINLVDLAGSERADATGATGVRLKEGANINKSLVTLGSVISSLAEASTNAKKKNLFIPYRDSVLTWLLKDSLGGNSKTIMIAAISPANVNYAETLSTLRYANRAKNIINKPTVNEDTNVKLIRDLRAEIEKLKTIIGNDTLNDAEKVAARKLYENEERLGQLTDKWKDRWKEMQKIMQERELAFQHRLDAGIRMESELPHLVALEEDLLSTGILLYPLKEGKTFVGTGKSDKKPDIAISGDCILDEHCYIENNNGFVVLNPSADAACAVNGTSVNKKLRLQQGDVVTLGTAVIFRFNHPKEAEELREKRKSVGPDFSGVANLNGKYRSESDLLKMRSPDRDKREENLARQLEEARLLLDKQKHEEERRMDETRLEFARQIREESQRLQETRGVLEQQRRARTSESLTPEEIRKNLEVLQKKHVEAERRRNLREKELSESIRSKEELIVNQQSRLKDVEEKCTQVKTNNSKLVDNEVEVYLKARATAMNEMSGEIRRIVDGAYSNEERSNVDDIRSIWESESTRITTQQKLCMTLSNEMSALLTTLESKADVSEDERMILEQRKSDLEKSFENAKTGLEEAYNNKAKSLAKYEHDFKNRYEIICWERHKSLARANESKEQITREKREHEERLLDVEGTLDEVKTDYYNTVTEQNEKLAIERIKIDQRKKDLIKQSIVDQRDFNDKVQQYRSLLTKSEDGLNEKKKETEDMRTQLTELMKSKSNTSKQRIDFLRAELNDKIENIHEMENNHEVIRTEEEKVIQNLMQELDKKKRSNELHTKQLDDEINGYEKQCRERILLLQEDVDMSEKTVIQCRSDIERDDEKLKEIDNLHEGENAKLDTDLLYVGYLLEKQFSTGDTNSTELESVLQSKATLEQLTRRYREQIESIKGVTDKDWKLLVDDREDVQVVLEDLIRTRGIAEVTLTELKEQFKEERRTEEQEIDRLREKLKDFEEEILIADDCEGNEIFSSKDDTDTISNNQKMMDEKQKLEDEMYDKILTVERAMQAEIDQLKQREMNLIACLQKDREQLVEEKSVLQKGKDTDLSSRKRLKDLVEEKDKELHETKEVASREVEELRIRLSFANKEIFALQEKLEKYNSLTSLNLDRNSTEDDLSDAEMKQILFRVNESSGIEEEDEEIRRMRISPPPTPINRFLQSVNTYRKNQIKVSVPRFILRGIGRGSYHVFEVKMNVGDDTWAVYRRYRRFRELHRDMIEEYSIVSNLEFPSKRYFGNRAERFVRARQAQLEAYLTALLAILSNMSSCCIYSVSNKQLGKRDMSQLHRFFKQGVYEYTKNESDFSP